MLNNIALKRLFALLLALTLTVTTCWAYTVPDDTIVYVTNTGTKYHRAGCTYLKSSRSMTIAQAVAAGYSPCSRCHPGQLTGNYVSTWDGEAGGSGGSAGSGKDTVKATPMPSPEPIEGEPGRINIGDIFAGVLCFLFLGFPSTMIFIEAIIEILILPIYTSISGFRERRRQRGLPPGYSVEHEEPVSKELPPCHSAEQEEPVSTEFPPNRPVEQEESVLEEGGDYWVTICTGEDKHGNPVYKTVYADNPDDLKNKVDAVTNEID